MNQEAFTDLGFLFREQPVQDYGIDAHVEIVENDAATGQLFGLQIKTGRSWFEEETPEGYVFRSDNEHVEYWLGHSLPVVVTLVIPGIETSTGNLFPLTQSSPQERDGN